MCNCTFKFMLTYFKLFSVYCVRKHILKVHFQMIKKAPNIQKQKAVNGGVVPLIRVFPLQQYFRITQKYELNLSVDFYSYRFCGGLRLCRTISIQFPDIQN